MNNAPKLPTRAAYLRDTRSQVVPDVQRWAVLCWDTIQAYAYEHAPSAIVCVLARDSEGAKEHIRVRYNGFEAFTTRIATHEDIEAGMTLQQFRDRYNTR